MTLDTGTGHDLSGIGSTRSAVVGRSPWVTAGIPAAAVLAAVVASICLGSSPSTLAEVWHAIVTPTGTDMDVTIRELRWPRTLTGIAAGACLGVAGLLTQGHTRNAVADPGLLGINQGAALAIVAATFTFGGLSVYTQATLAFFGALLASVVVFLIGTAARHGATPITLVLSGAAVTALCGGVVTGLTLLDEASLDTLRFWQVGSLAARSNVIDSLWPFVLAGLLLAVLNIGALNTLALGEDVARSLGTSVLAARSTGIAAITLLAGCAVTMAGPIAFAGLVVPHLARAVAGGDYRRSLPAAAAIGVGLVLVADTAGRLIARPGELSVGVVLAVIGAPFFVLLARRRRMVTV
ncbi:iron complex transport system permease protein [Prauserella marina]|uniref:Iron complex transport system permease protein n=1 Tax=Prauserella marina TaxID=530584 RepID=A0A1G6Y3U8_9PSEU|nr:iron ABC transporter permease [Prauserella marina]PWV80046.1 iron complex transport system permease protein [Prauserella marina]SDD84387.1 iron complex transport system permease protein [Prauserella marina]